MKFESITILEFKTCCAKLVEDQFVKISFYGEEDCSLKDITCLTDTVLEFMNGKPFVCLTDFGQYFGTFSLEVKKYLTTHKDLEKFKYQEAFIICKLGMWMQSNFYFKLNPSMRIKVFKNEMKATEWLLKKREDILL